MASTVLLPQPVNGDGSKDESFPPMQQHLHQQRLRYEAGPRWQIGGRQPSPATDHTLPGLSSYVWSLVVPE